jgi:hypothetical protein
MPVLEKGIPRHFCAANTVLFGQHRRESGLLEWKRGVATPARCCVAAPWHCDAAPKRQDELGAIVGPKKHQRGVLCPIEGCWGPILPFGSCRLGHF